MLKIVLLGIVEGITEWLPISSTGHLILLDEWIRLEASEEFKEMQKSFVLMHDALSQMLKLTDGICLHL